VLNRSSLSSIESLGNIDCQQINLADMLGDINGPFTINSSTQI